MPVRQLLLTLKDEAAQASFEYMLVIGLGMGLMFQTYILAVQNAVQPREMGIASAAVQFFRSIGGTLSVAILGTLMTTRFQGGFTSLLPDTLKQAVPAERLAAFQNPQVLLAPQATPAP